MTLPFITDWTGCRYECVTGPYGQRRPREEPHGNRHLDGCRRIAKCGCVQPYYSSYLYRRKGFHFHNPDKSFWDVAWEGRCLRHFKAYLEKVSK